MKERRQLIKKKEKDGIIRIVTEVKGVKTSRVQEYFDKNTGHFSIDTFDEEGNIVSGVGGYAPDIVISALKNTDKKKAKRETSK